MLEPVVGSIRSITRSGMYSNSKPWPMLSSRVFTTWTCTLPGVMVCGATHPINVDEIRFDDIAPVNPNLHLEIPLNPDP